MQKELSKSAYNRCKISHSETHLKCTQISQLIILYIILTGYEAKY